MPSTLRGMLMNHLICRLISCPASLLFGVLTVAGCSSPSSPVVLPGPTPSQPVVLAGAIWESGTHTPLADARICWSNHCATTLEDGTFRLDTTAMSAPGYSICVVTGKQGFEWRNDCVPTRSVGVAQYNTSLQRSIVINAGDTVTDTVYFDDASGTILEDACERCKRVLVTIPRNGELRTSLAADGGSGQVSLTPATPLAVRAGTTVLLLITANTQQAFRLSTELVSE